MEELKKPDPV